MVLIVTIITIQYLRISDAFLLKGKYFVRNNFLMRTVVIIKNGSYESNLEWQSDCRK